jgi:hypothetical protein
VPRRSARLAKKACSHVPAVAASQNVLMWKLGLATSVHVETEDFERYVALFKDGLSKEQVELNKELFLARAPPCELGSEVEELQ